MRSVIQWDFEFNTHLLSGASPKELGKSTIRSTQIIFCRVQITYHGDAFAEQCERWVKAPVASLILFENIYLELLSLMHFLMPEKCKYTHIYDGFFLYSDSCIDQRI